MAARAGCVVSLYSLRDIVHLTWKSFCDQLLLFDVSFRVLGKPYAQTVVNSYIRSERVPFTLWLPLACMYRDILQQKIESLELKITPDERKNSAIPEEVSASFLTQPQKISQKISLCRDFGDRPSLLRLLRCLCFWQLADQPTPLNALHPLLDQFVLSKSPMLWHRLYGEWKVGGDPPTQEVDMQQAVVEQEPSEVYTQAARYLLQESMCVDMYVYTVPKEVAPKSCPCGACQYNTPNRRKFWKTMHFGYLQRRLHVLKLVGGKPPHAPPRTHVV